MRALLDAFRLAPGSVGLVAARVIAVEVAAIPAWIAARGVLEAGPARSPWFTSGVMDAEHVARLGMALSPVLAWVPVSLGLGWLLCAVTDAAAIRVLTPGRAAPRVAHAIAREGPAELWTLLRIACVVALPLSLLLWAVGHTAALADRALDRAGATALLQVGILPVSALASALLAAGLGSAASTWCRVITLLDDRTRTRRSLLLALAVFRAVPAAPLVFLATTAAAKLAGLAMLVIWRQAEPWQASISGAVPLALLGSLAATVLQALAWHGLTRGAVLGWTAPRLAHLRARPDAPLGILRARAWSAGSSPPDPDPA